MRDNYNGQAFRSALTAAVRTADANGATVDLQGFNAAAITAAVGVSGDTLSGSVKVELEVQHSLDDGAGAPAAWVACADADLLNSVTGTNTGTFAVIDDAAEDDAVYATGYVGGRRFVRVVANLTGTHTNGIPLSAVAVLGEPDFAPAS